MSIKNERGFTGTDISIAIVIITVFLALIINLIVGINLNIEETKRKSYAVSYATQIIEKIKAQGYIDSYDNKGIDNEEILEEEDIKDKDGNYTGYHKKITIKDYYYVSNAYETEKQNLVKVINVKVSYKFNNQYQEVSFDTNIIKE